MKATYGEVRLSEDEIQKILTDGGQVPEDHIDRREIWKDPVTDDGTKKSKKGLLRVDEVNNNIVCFDQQTYSQEAEGLLETVFYNSKLYNFQTLDNVRERLSKN